MATLNVEGLELQRYTARIPGVAEAGALSFQPLRWRSSITVHAGERIVIDGKTLIGPSTWALPLGPSPLRVEPPNE